MRASTQEKILDFVQAFVEDNGYAPSIREICAGTGVKSTSTVHYHLQALSDRGVLRRQGNKNRAISLAEGPGRIPVVGVVAAGQPILAQENIESYLPWEGAPGCFALQVRGQSMKDAGILSGDRVIVRPQPVADNGDIVVALLEDEATVKRFHLDSDGIWLLPENPDYSPIDGAHAVIVGKVIGVVRFYR